MVASVVVTGFAQIPFVDPHFHSDSRSCEEFARLRLAGCRGIVTLAGAGAGYRSPDSVLDHFRRIAILERRRISSAGITAIVGLGLHPAAIPESGLRELLDGLRAALEEYGAQAVGEIGLQDCSKAEEEAFEHCLNVASELGLPAIVHTPRTDKSKVLQRILEIISASRQPADRVLLDHLDRDGLSVASKSACWLGLSVHPAKLSPEQAASAIVEFGPERLILSSDTGIDQSYLFAFPATVSALQARDFPESDIGKVVFKNALELLGVQL